MKATRQLHDLGQSLWLDNITRTLLDDGTLARYINEDSITGLTSNPSIFDKAIGDGDAYDAGIHAKTLAGLAGEKLFIELALEDLRRAADLFAPVYQRTAGVDGWVSMEVSPLLAADTAGSVAAARQIHAAGKRDNLFVKIPGTPEGASRRDSIRACARWPRCSSAAGTWPPTSSCPRRCTTSSASRWRGRPIAPTAGCWPPTAG